MSEDTDRERPHADALRRSTRGVAVRAPLGFEHVPPDMRHEASGMRVWFIEPLGILTQVSEQHRADLEMAQFLSGPVTERLLQLRGDREDKLFFVHEWSAMTGYTKETRSEMTRWGLAMRPLAEEIVVHLGPQASSLVRMGVNVASGALRFAGIRITLADDFESALQARKVGPLRVSGG